MGSATLPPGGDPPKAGGGPPKGVAVVGGHVQGYVVRVERLPRPDETVMGSAFEEAEDGGKGSHQAIAAARLGASCSFVGAVGQDRLGDQAMRWLHAAGVRTDGVLRCDAPTGVGLVILDARGVPAIVTVMGANAALTPEYLSSAAGVLARHRVLLVSLEIPPETAARAIELGREAGMTVILNPAPFSPLLPRDRLAQVDVLTPNDVEAAQMLEWLGLSPPRGPATEQDGSSTGGPSLARLVLERTRAGSVVVTCGERGAEVALREDARVRSFRVEALPVVARDTTGAGDAFNAGLAVAISEGAGLEAAVRFASVVAACSVTRPGSLASFPMRPEVEAFAADRGLRVLPGLASPPS